VLDDEILFNEFFEFCKQKCCIENAVNIYILNNNSNNCNNNININII